MLSGMGYCLGCGRPTYYVDYDGEPCCEECGGVPASTLYGDDFFDDPPYDPYGYDDSGFGDEEDFDWGEDW